MSLDVYDNLFDRINEVKERNILLSLIAESEKLFDNKDLDFREYFNIVRTFLSQISAPLFGQLTENEFINVFGKLFLKKGFEFDFFPLLIQSLSNTESADVYKFTKIIDLINALQKDLILESLRNQSKNNENDLKKKLLETNFSQVLCSFSDRIYNFFGSPAVNNTSVCALTLRQFEDNLLLSIKEFVLEANNSINFDLCSKIIMDYSHVSNRFFEALLQWLLKNVNQFKFQLFFIFSNPVLDSVKYQQFLENVVSFINNGYDLEILFGNSIYQNFALQNVCTHRLLTKQLPRISSDDLKKRNSFKIINYLYKINANKIINDCFIEFVEIFCNQSNHLNIISYEYQIQLAVCVLDFAKGIDKKNLNDLKQNILVELAQIVPQYLKLADNSRRQIGMFIGEYLSNLFALNSKEELHFDYINNDVLNDLKEISIQPLDSIVCNNKQLTTDLQLNIKKVKQISKIVDLRTRILDSDDDDNDNFFIDNEAKIKYDDKIFDEEVMEYEQQNRIYYIQDCLDSLYNEKEDFKNFALTIRTLPKLIRKRDLEFDSIAIQLLDQMICIENRFKIPDFQELRMESAMLILAYHPELVSHAIRVLFSKQCSMNNRYFILKAIEKASLFLYEGCPINEKINKVEIVTDNVKKNSFENKTTTIGKVIRSNLLPKEPKPSRNLFLNYVSQFLYPLLNVQNVGSHLDLYDKDHILLGKILATIGQLIIYGKNSPQITRIISIIFTLLATLRRNPHTFVLSGCLFCYSSAVDAMLVIENFNIELNDCFEWLTNLLETYEKLEADPMLRETLNITLFKVGKALLKDEKL